MGCQAGVGPAKLTTMTTKSKSNPTESFETIKLGIDAHAKWYYVGRQVDGATPQPVQKMTYEGLLRFVAKQKRLCGKLYTCYEAGAFGYHLHRQLEMMGVTNYVVQPQNWDERGKGVKNDRIDALALCQRLDRFVLGNRKAFSIVRVPSEEEERERAFSRQRQQLVRERQRLQAMGRSLLAMHGIHVTGRWWKGKTWATIASEAPEWVIERLQVFIRLVEPVGAEEVKLTAAIEQAAEEEKIPKGVGALSFEVLRREVGDWSRFNNRREVSSYTGLCPREHSSGGKRRGGSVSKSGNPRVRAMLVEMVWRMIRWQPHYKPLIKWAPVLGDPSRSSAVRKKAIVAVARQLAVDLWRLFTGQTTAENLGLIYLPEPAPLPTRPTRKTASATS
jgi:transposase